MLCGVALPPHLPHHPNPHGHDSPPPPLLQALAAAGVVVATAADVAPSLCVASATGGVISLCALGTPRGRRKRNTPNCDTAQPTLTTERGGRRWPDLQVCTSGALRHAEEEEAVVAAKVTLACTRGGAAGAARNCMRADGHRESRPRGEALTRGGRFCEITREQRSEHAPQEETHRCRHPRCHAKGPADMRRRRKATWA